MKPNALLLALPLALAAPAFAQTSIGDADAKSTSYVRVLHGIGGGPEVDLYVDGRRQRTNLAFQSITEYLQLPAGAHTLTSRGASARAGTGRVLLSLKRTFAPGAYYVIAAASRAGRPTGIVTNESSAASPRSGRAAIRFYHLSLDAGPVTITSLGSRILLRSIRPGQSRDATVGEQTFVVDVRAEGPRGRRLATREVRVRPGERYSAFVVGDTTVIDYIRHSASTHIFSASMPPANVATVLACLDILEQEPERLDRLAEISDYMRDGFRALGFDVWASQTPIIPVVIGEMYTCFRFWKDLLGEGVFTNPVIPPAVPRGQALMRTSYMASHSNAELDLVLDAFRTVGLRHEIITDGGEMGPARIQAMTVNGMHRSPETGAREPGVHGDSG